MEIIPILEDILDDIVILIAAVGIVLLTILVVFRRTRPEPDKNPFSLDFLRDPSQLETDQVKRHNILKQRKFGLSCNKYEK